MSCCDNCCENACSNCVESCGCCQSCQDSCDSCCQNCTQSCCQSCCDSCCDSCNCCGNASGVSILKINTLTSFSVMILSLVSGIIGIFKDVPISITFLSIGLILISVIILGLMIFPRISQRNDVSE